MDLKKYLLNLETVLESTGKNHPQVSVRKLAKQLASDLRNICLVDRQELIEGEFVTLECLEPLPIKAFAEPAAEVKPEKKKGGRTKKAAPAASSTAKVEVKAIIPAEKEGK